jgi:hypothetical protein
VFWQRQQTRVLREFEAQIELYQQAYIISYLPLSQAFGIREEINQRAPIDKPIVLLEIEMPTSCKFYRWQREGTMAAILQRRGCANDRAKIAQQWELIFQQIERDMRRELDRQIFNWTM